MTTIISDVRKKLAFRFILQNIDYKKKCLYLQEIVQLGKGNDLWKLALIDFFDQPVRSCPSIVFSKN